jgi:hypothetical protein
MVGSETPLSTVFKSHCDNHFGWQRKQECLEKTTDLMQATGILHYKSKIKVVEWVEKGLGER